MRIFEDFISQNYMIYVPSRDKLRIVLMRIRSSIRSSEHSLCRGKVTTDSDETITFQIFRKNLPDLNKS